MLAAGVAGVAGDGAGCRGIRLRGDPLRQRRHGGAHAQRYDLGRVALEAMRRRRDAVDRRQPEMHLTRQVSVARLGAAHARDGDADIDGEQLPPVGGELRGALGGAGVEPLRHAQQRRLRRDAVGDDAAGEPLRRVLALPEGARDGAAREGLDGRHGHAPPRAVGGDAGDQGVGAVHARRYRWRGDAEVVTLRRALHADPELGLELPRTQQKVLAALEGLPLEITTGTRTTSVVAVLRGAHPGPVVLLRGDMDALPIGEATGLEYASTNGNMHACGHDLHTAGLVGAAKLLPVRQSELHGSVIFMFQPAEEGHGAATLMFEEGLLDAGATDHSPRVLFDDAVLGDQAAALATVACARTAQA